MDSINKEQKEDVMKDLAGTDAVKKIKELTDKAQTCFFCTNVTDELHFPTRPMAVQKVDDEGNLWFLSAKDSHKNQELKSDTKVQLFFQGSPHSDFLSLSGKVTITDDKEKIKELWQPILKDWFTEGVDDPRISVLKVVPETGYYWDTKHGMAVSLIKRITGAVIGKTMDDSVEGTISV